MAKAKVTLYPAQVSKLMDAAYEALEDTAVETLKDITTQAVVPKDTGMLETSGGASIDLASRRRIAKIIYNTPYARRLYFHPEYNFRTDRNRNAQGRWMDSYTKENSDNFKWLVSVFSKLFEEKLKEKGIL